MTIALVMTTVTKILGLIVNNLTYVFDQGVHAYVSMCLVCTRVCVCISAQIRLILFFTVMK